MRTYTHERHKKRYARHKYYVVRTSHEQYAEIEEAARKMRLPVSEMMRTFFEWGLETLANDR